jgi:hypothetical protein
VGAASHTTPITELLPIWLQKSFGAWTSFGGGGFVNNPGSGSRDFEIYGWGLQRQLTNKLALGGEIFGQTRSSASLAPGTAAGLAALYDFNNEWHLVGSVNTGIVDARQGDRFSYNLALKWTH